MRARRSIRRSALMIGLAAALTATLAPTPNSAEAGVRFSDGSESYVEFGCLANLRQIRVTAWHTGYRSGDHFRFLPYNYYTGTYGSWSAWDAIPTTFTFSGSTSPGAQFNQNAFWVEYLHYLPNGQAVRWQEWGKVRQDGSRNYRTKCVW